MKPTPYDSSFLPSMRLTIISGVAAVALLVSGLGVWGTQAMIDGATVASGRVIVERNRQAVQHPDGGVVAEVLVREGDAVKRGQTLVRLDPTLALSELSIAESQLYELIARRGRLAAERDDRIEIEFDPALLAAAASDRVIAEVVEGQVALFQARQSSLRQAIVQMETQKQELRNQIAGVDAVDGSLHSQRLLVEEELKLQEELQSRGLSPISRVLALRREAARLTGAAGEAAARRAQALERIAQIEIELERLQSQRREEAITLLRDLQVSEREVAERRATILTRLEKMSIQAPIDGVAYDIRLLGERSVLRAADPALFIVPQDRPLVIECRISPMDIGLARVGQDVVIRFPAFDMRETPDLIGHITQISPDSLEDSSTGLAFFRIEVELPDTERRKLRDDQTILPGMPVDAYLRTGEYSPLEYLVRPLMRYMNTAMRDGG